MTSTNFFGIRTKSPVSIPGLKGTPEKTIKDNEVLRIFITW